MIPNLRSTDVQSPECDPHHRRGNYVHHLNTSSLAGEKVWDNELRRFLKDDDFKFEEFMNEEDALKAVLPKSQRVRKELLRLTAEKKELIEQRIGWKFPEDSFELYIGQTGEKVDGYAMVHHTIGEYKPMTYMVGVDATEPVPTWNFSCFVMPREVK